MGLQEEKEGRAGEGGILGIYKGIKALLLE